MKFSIEKPQHHKKETVNKESHGKRKIEHSSDLIEYLNKARQGGVEYESIYRHVIGNGSLDSDSYPKSLVNRPDLLEKFAVGKNGEPYQNTRDAAHDLVEFLANEAEGKMKQQEVETREKTKHQEIKKEIDSQKDLLELLNKARQGTVEHEDVYWHVFGKGSKTGVGYPKSLVNRSDLLEKFAVGKNGEPYQNTRDAAHDLIEFLANEAEGKMKQLTPDEKSEPTPPTTPEPVEPEKPATPEEKKKPEEKEGLVIIFIDLLKKAEGGDAEAIKILIEFVITHKIELTIVGPQPTSEEIEAQRILIILLEKIRGGDITVINQVIQIINIHTTNITIINIGPTRPPEPPRPPETISSLDDLRDAYLKAKRLRGNVFRGGFGRFFKRKLNFGGTEMDFGGQVGKTDLEIVRMEYQEGLDRYRRTELQRLQTDLTTRLLGSAITPAVASAEMQTKIVDLLGEEQGNIDNKSVTGIERNMFEKMKTKWRQFGKTRLITGGLLGGAALATGGTAIGASIVGIRAGMGAVGTYVGTEAGLERYSKLIGHKGLVKEISRTLGTSVFGSGLDPARKKSQINNYLDTLPPDDIKKEAARLRMLQVEKGVSIDDLNTLGDNGDIAALIIKRENELTAKEAMNTAHLDPALIFADRLSNRLAVEINLKNEVIESEVDKERIKKMFRKTTAVLAGGAVGWLIGGKLFQHHDATPAPSPNHVSTPEHAPDPIPTPEHVAPPDLHTVASGENLWDIIKSDLNFKHAMEGLPSGAQDHMIDALKDKFAAMTTTELHNLGFDPTHAFHTAQEIINNLHPAEILNLSGVLDDPGVIARAFLHAQTLSPADIAYIHENGHIIADWLTAHHTELTSVFGSDKISEVLKAAGR